MNEILDSNTHSLVELVEDYISQKRNRAPIDTEHFKSKLNRLGYSSDQISDILIEMDDDADKELLAGDGTKKAKQKLVLGLIIGILGMIFTITYALGAFGGSASGIVIIPFGLIGGAFIIAGKTYTELGLVKKRKKRRSLKYEKWS